MITLDFETFGIKGNPLVNPPEPVGLAVWAPGSEPTYLAWGHPTENNISRSEGLEYARRVFGSGEKLLFHNAPFDISVMEGTGTQWFWKWSQIHDTQYLCFLSDPYADSLSLKPSAARYLGMPPDEQDELRAWILSNVSEATEKDWGAYIAYAPGDLVGRYAIGDVVRTRRLFDHLHPRILDSGMGEAYDRERRLMPILMESSKQGIRVDVERMEYQYGVYRRALELADDRIRGRLDSPNLDFGKRGELAEALDRAGFVDEWALTPTGRRSTSKKNMKVNDPDLDNLIKYRGSLNTCLSTFMGPWLELSKQDGRLHTQWNSVRTVERDSRGTKTGRISSNGPNFTNIPNEFEGIETPAELVPLPYMRQYLLPEPGHVWLKRDFSSQELRILAHFEDGSLCLAYRENPSLDPHQMAIDMIRDMIGMEYKRKSIKITAFSIVYGSGATGLSKQLGQSIDEAKRIKDAYLAVNPGIKRLTQDVTRIAKGGGFVRTWGGRVFYAEPPKIIDNAYRSFEYKVLNYLIQGSAADQTKDTIIQWNERRDSSVMFLAQVYDELNISAPADEWERHMAVLKDEMEKDRFDVPFKSEGFKGRSWHEASDHRSRETSSDGSVGSLGKDENQERWGKVE